LAAFEEGWDQDGVYECLRKKRNQSHNAMACPISVFESRSSRG
jgi:hypothetical protein